MVAINQLKEPNVTVAYRLSVFIWLVIGRENLQQSCSSKLQSFFVFSVNDSLQRFWEIDEVSAIKHLTPEKKG